MPLAVGDFEYVRSLVRERAAIVLEDNKGYLVETRLMPVAKANGMDSIATLVDSLRMGRPGLRERVVEALTTNETSFFRDVHPFEALRTQVLPDLLRARAAQRRLSIWCAACSSGQEPYTIAMLLKDHFPQRAGWAIDILATDLSEGMIARAQTGVYSQIEVNRGLPAPLLVKHFTRDGAQWRISPELRAMVRFRTLNLARPWPPTGPVDLLFLRNVLIYFDIATKRDILTRAHRALADDGLLFLGGTETTLGVHDGFERVVIGRSTAYRRR